jgi:acetyltransferase-like isoleucine patch superfamily enzyme/uncharacterized membrane protein YbhN (UPF0104 family)
MRRIGWAVKLGFSAALLYLLLRRYPISLDTVGETFRSVNLPLLALALVLLFTQYVLSSIKWRLILESHGIRLPLGLLVQSYLIGNFFSAFLPSSYMGDFVRIADVSRRSGRTFESASAVVLERLSGLAALTAAGCAASLYIRRAYDQPVFGRLAVFLGGVLLLLIVAFLPGVLPLLRRIAGRIPIRLARKVVDKVDGAVSHYRSLPWLLAGILFWSFAFQAAAYTIFYIYGRALHIPLPYVYCFAFVPVVYILEALPISIAGFGLREGGLIYFLGLIGLSSSEAVALSIIVLSGRYAMNLVGGVLFAMRRQAFTPSEPPPPSQDAPAPQGSRGHGGPLAGLRRTLTRRFVPGFIVTLYYYARCGCIVHPRAAVQLSDRIRFGRKTTIHPYTRIILGGGSVTMGSFCNLQSFSTIAAGDSTVLIGNDVRIGPNCNLLGEDHEYRDRNTPVHRQGRIVKGLEIGDDVWVGANCIILPGVRIGRGAIIGAGSVVTKSLSPFTVAVGNPARSVRER